MYFKTLCSLARSSTSATCLCVEKNTPLSRNQVNSLYQTENLYYVCMELCIINSAKRFRISHRKGFQWPASVSFSDPTRSTSSTRLPMLILTCVSSETKSRRYVVTVFPLREVITGCSARSILSRSSRSETLFRRCVVQTTLPCGSVVFQDSVQLG